ncbi:unnamed protein product [Toxocara canis]|uniref:Uncharacterized protein n=1 Tax=Toxocara canis TaxID=6265 RepID=A0A183U5M2_TOXCA|nr:unnamed protein product [Toxocara canis]
MAITTCCYHSFLLRLGTERNEADNQIGTVKVTGPETETSNYSSSDYEMGIAFVFVNGLITIAVCILGVIVGMKGYELLKARGKPKSAPNTARLAQPSLGATNEAAEQTPPQQDERQ